MGALEDSREVGLLPQGPRPGASTEVHKVAQLLSVDATTQRASVSIDGSQPVWLPYVPGVYTGYTTCLVLCNPSQGGRAVWVLGPVGVQSAADTPPAPPAPPSSVTATATILPTWSGTWRAGQGWDQWNVGRYGGRSDLYQGNDYGSGVLTGLAVYGDQIVNLSALTITAATVTMNISNGYGTPVVQGSPAGTPYPSGPPPSSGATNTGTGVVALDPTTCEALRTGAFKGLALVGSGYADVFGTSRPDGMALHLTYTRAG